MIMINSTCYVFKWDPERVCVCVCVCEREREAITNLIEKPTQKVYKLVDYYKMHYQIVEFSTQIVECSTKIVECSTKLNNAISICRMLYRTVEAIPY